MASLRWSMDPLPQTGRQTETFGVIHIWRPLWGIRGVVRQKWDVNGRAGGGGVWVYRELWRSNLYLFFIKENWIYAMTRHHAGRNINMLVTRNLSFDSGVRWCSNSLMIPLHCLWAKSKNRALGQFECDVAWFCFCFDLVCSYAGCGFGPIVCLRF